MRLHLPAVVLVGLLAPLACTPAAEEATMIELAAPRPIARGEAVQLEVTAGPLPRGGRLALITENGEILGAVAPFGPPGSRGPTTATVPVPPSALIDGKLRLRLQVLEPGAQPRAPRPGEVGRVELVVVPQGR
jgi:hypothetical protein